MLLKATTAVTIRMQELKSKLHRDRGEGPVPYIVMVALVAIAAAGIAVAIRQFANGRVADINNIQRTNP